MLAIERDVFGSAHEDITRSLLELAELHTDRGEFAAARQEPEGFAGAAGTGAAAK